MLLLAMMPTSLFAEATGEYLVENKSAVFMFIDEPEHKDAEKLYKVFTAKEEDDGFMKSKEFIYQTTDDKLDIEMSCVKSLINICGIIISASEDIKISGEQFNFEVRISTKSDTGKALMKNLKVRNKRKPIYTSTIEKVSITIDRKTKELVLKVSM